MTLFDASLQRVVLPLLEDLDTPRALSVAILIRYGEWGQLVNLRADPAHYATALSYYRAAVATELLRKADFLETGIDTAEVAMRKWFEAERRCAETNSRLDRFLHNGPFEEPTELRIADHIDDLKRTVATILGSLPRTLDVCHGPGATFHDPGRRSTVPDKMTSRPTVTSACRAFLPLWERTAWCRGLIESHPNRSDPKTVRGNRFVCVPKDATTDRPIAIEPSLNVAYQLHVGAHIRRRLDLFGLNLVRGQELHRRVAEEASLTEEFATIDLTSASDTISSSFVKLVLPEHWFDLLDSLRSKTTNVNGVTYVLQKFSSMGNGFTFELETLLFASVAAQAVKASGIEPLFGVNVFVYGDDIIIPKGAVRNLLALLRFYGFQPNERKTFLSGNFRESCGGDYFNGHAVRPHYLKSYPSEPAAWITLANGLRRVEEQFTSLGAPGVTRRAWFRVLDAIPAPIRKCRGPSQLGDVLIHDVESRWNFVIRHSIRYFRIWRPVMRSKPLSRYNTRTGRTSGCWAPGPTMAAALYGTPASGPFVRGSVSGYRFGRAAFS